MKDAILDGEIVCLDVEGRSLFRPLLFRRQNAVYAAFDVVWVNGHDLRDRRLVERKERLRGILPAESPYLLRVDYLPERGSELFAFACDKDLWKASSASGRTGHVPDGRALDVVGEGKQRELLAGRGPR